MSKNQQLGNPFYVVVLLVGILFVITTCGYVVLTVRGLQPAADSAVAEESGSRLMWLLDEHGFTLLMIELAALGVVTFAAMATDQYWMRKGSRGADRQQRETMNEE